MVLVVLVVYTLTVGAGGLVCVSLVLLRHEAHRGHDLVLDRAIPFPSLLSGQLILDVVAHLDLGQLRSHLVQRDLA